MVAKYSEWNRGQDKALLNKLGGDDVARRLLDCREVKVEFDSAAKSAMVTGIAPVFKVWRTIKVGTGLNSADDFRKALQASNCKISDYASSMLDDPKFVVSSAEQNVNLGNMSVAELGFDKGARYDEICARIIELGHQLCEPEDGPQLRKQHLDQLPGEEVRMAMEPLRDSHGLLHIFHVIHYRYNEGGLGLTHSYGNPDIEFLPDARFAFRLSE